MNTEYIIICGISQANCYSEFLCLMPVAMSTLDDIKGLNPELLQRAIFMTTISHMILCPEWFLEQND